MPSYHPPVETVIFLTAFFVVYLFFLIKKTMVDSIDLFDFLLLSTIAIGPMIFMVLPDLPNRFSKWIGITFPFLLLFGFLFLVVFVYLHRIAARIHKHEVKLKTLVQEIAFSNDKIQRSKKLSSGRPRKR